MLLKIFNCRFCLVLTVMVLFSCSVLIAHDKTVVLSFDDGPHKKTTEKIIKILNDNSVPGTFFLVGVMIEKYPELVKKIYENGFEIGNHTYSDTRLTAMSKEHIKDALSSVNNLLEKTVGKKTSFFRPPGGRINDTVIDSARALGLYPVLWSRYVGDTARGITSQEILKRATVRPGHYELIMMHDGPEETLEALPEIIKFYKKKGYKFATVSEIASPVLLNITAVKKRKIAEWPVMLGEGKLVQNEEAKGKNTAGVAGFIALFASIGSTYYFIRINKSSGQFPVSLVFIGASAGVIEEIISVLNNRNIRGTFFVNEEQMEYLKNFADWISIAYYKEESVYSEEKLKKWEDKANDCGFSIIPLFYGEENYDKETISLYKEKGFVPVDWKMSSALENNGDYIDIAKYIEKKLNKQKVIPLSGKSPQTPLVINEIVNKVPENNLYFLPLEDFILKRFVN